MPSSVGGKVVTWTVSPMLPAGLEFDPTSGTISGQATVASAPANFVVTATNSGGQAMGSLTIAVAGSPLLDLGHSERVSLLRFTNSSVLSQDTANLWILQNYTSGTTLARGSASFVDLKAGTMVDETSAGLEVRAAASGQLLGTVLAQPSWWQLASDGSYVIAGSTTALTAWSTSGQLLASLTGDYSKAVAFAAPGAIFVALGPAGQNVIQTLSVTSGSSSTSAAFQGVFNSWFLDGQRFLTTQGSTVWVYSNTAVQQDIASLSTIAGLTGQGNYFWYFDKGQFAVYQIGASASPALTFSGAQIAIPSDSTVALLINGSGGDLWIVDLSSTSPAIAHDSLPFTYLFTYAAMSPTAWLVGNDHGVIFDGASLGTTPRTLTLGAAYNIAGGTGSVSVATASGSIFSFNTSTNALERTINFPSSQLASSSDGTVLAAVQDVIDGQYNSPLVNVYSLPSGSPISSLPSVESPFITLSGSGAILGQLDTAPYNAQACYAQTTLVTGGNPILCDSVQGPSRLELSPDGTLAAVSTALTPMVTTNIYQNGKLVTTVPGWAVDWLDNGRLLVNNYKPVGQLGFPEYASATIFSPTGANLGNVPLPELHTIQPISSDLVYSPDLNAIVSLTTGAFTWASGNLPTKVGAVGGPEIVFAPGNLVLAQPF